MKIILMTAIVFSGLSVMSNSGDVHASSHPGFIQPVSIVSNTAGEFNATTFAADNVFDGAGLSALSGSATYTWTGGDGSYWHASGGTFSGTIRLDLGNDFDLDEFYLWGLNHGAGNLRNHGVRNFTLEFFQSDGVSLIDSFIGVGAENDGTAVDGFDSPVVAQVFSFAAVADVRFVDLVITDTFGGAADNAPPIIGELGFNAVVIPEPASASLLAMAGVFGLGTRRRRRS